MAGKKSKRCGRGKIADGKGGCRKMTYRELSHLNEKTVLGAAAGSMVGIKKSPAGALVGGAVGGYVRRSKAKKKMSEYYKKKK